MTSRPTAPTTKVGARMWTAVALIGLIGQLAWTVENMYLNVYVYETITDDPSAIAAMVAASAIVATLAALAVGAWSDRVGRRRAFITVGYVAWGIATACFGAVSVQGIAALGITANTVAFAVIAIITLDCVMTLFGSGANDGVFNAWVTDSTVPDNRGRVEGVIAVLPLMSTLLVFGLLDPMTRDGQWRAFFLLVGALVAATGIVAWFLIDDSHTPKRSQEGMWRAMAHTLRPAAVKANPPLYLALVALAISNTASQVFLPYLIIYLQKYLRIEAYVVVLGVVLVGASAISVLGGRLIDKVGKVRFILPAAACFALGLVGMFFARGMVPVMAAGLVAISGMMLVAAAVGATVRDNTPEGRAGAIQGLRMVFHVLIPMVIGPAIGAAVIKGQNEFYEDLGVMKQVPTPGIFLAAAIVVVFVAIPVWALLRRRGGAVPAGRDDGGARAGGSGAQSEADGVGETGEAGVRGGSGARGEVGEPREAGVHGEVGGAAVAGEPGMYRGAGSRGEAAE